MVKRRERSEVEYLRGEVRKLKSENRHLRKTLGRAHKQTRRYADSASDEEETIGNEVAVEPAIYCPDCKEEVKIKELGNRMLLSCDCGFTKSITKKRT